MKRILIYIITIIICCISIGYSAFNQELLIDDIVAEVRIKADSRLTGLLYDSSEGDGLSQYEDYNIESLLMNVVLPNQNSTVTYKAKVTNFGNQEMGIYDITGLPENLEYSISGYNLQDKICSSTSCTLGAIKEFYITIKYKKNGFNQSNIEYNLNLNMDFRKMHTITYTGITNNNYPTSVIDGGNLTFTATSNVPPKIVAFNSAGSRYDYNSYSYVNGNFRFDNVTSDINLKYQARADLVTSAGNSHFKEADYVSKIKNVEFVNYIDENAVSNALKSYDLSSNGDGSIIGWIDSNYKLWIGSDWTIYTGVLNEFFYQMSAVESIKFSNINTSKTYTMYKMFAGCSSLKTLDLSSFNTDWINAIHGLFTDCSSLTSLNLGNFKTKKVTSFINVFHGCSSLTSLDLSSFDTSNGTTFQGMFKNVSSLKSIDISGFDTSKSKSFSEMFRGCSSLVSIDLSNFSTASANDLSLMFYECYLLEKLDVSGFDTSKVTNMAYLFGRCRALVELDLSNFVTSLVTRMEYMFYDARSLENLDISSFNTANVTNMKHMFHDAFAITTLDLGHFVTSKVTEMASMFQNTKALYYLDVSSFDTSKVNRMDYMFSGMTSISQLDLQNFDISSLTNALYMFYKSSSISKVLVSDLWAMPSGCNTTNMFLYSGISNVSYV